MSVQNPWIKNPQNFTKFNFPWWPFQSGSGNNSKSECYIRISNTIRFQSGLRGRRTILNLERERVLTLMSIYTSLGENSTDQLFLNSHGIHSFSTNNINVGRLEPRQRSNLVGGFIFWPGNKYQARPPRSFPLERVCLPESTNLMLQKIINFAKSQCSL